MLTLGVFNHWVGGGGGGDELIVLTPGVCNHWVGTLQIISLVFAAGTLRRASLGSMSKNPSKKSVSADVHQCLDVNRLTKSTTPSERMQIRMNS